MTQMQFQRALQTVDADNPNSADVDKFFGQYEQFVKARKSDKVYRSGTRAFFLLLDFILLLAYGLLTVQQESDKLSPLKFFFLPLVGVGICSLWWHLVKLFCVLCRGNWNLENHLRRSLLNQAIRMQWYWFLERIPLHDDTLPEKVAAALPLTFIPIHILLAGLGIAQLM